MSEEFEKIRDTVELMGRNHTRRVNIECGIDDASIYTKRDLGFKASATVQQQGRDNGIMGFEIQKELTKVGESVEWQTTQKERAAQKYLERLLSRGYYGYIRLMKLLDRPVESPTMHWWNWRYVNPIMGFINPGGEVKVREGTYSVATPLIQVANVTLAGVSRTSTILELGANDYLIKSHVDPSASAPLSRTELKHLYLDGKKATYATGKSLLYGAYVESTFEDLFIINGHESNILLVAGTGGGYENYFKYIQNRLSDQRGFEATGVNDCHIIECTMHNHTLDTLRLTTCANWKVYGGYIGNTREIGAYVSGCSGPAFIGVRFEWCDKDHLSFKNSYRAQTIGCKFYRESGISNTYQGMVYDDSYQCTGMGNSFARAGAYTWQYFIKEISTGSCYDNKSIGDIFGAPRGTDFVLRAGVTLLKLVRCPNFVNDNSGTSTGTGAQQTIAHGLNVTPNRVLLSESTTGGALAYQSAAADATNIYITAVLNKTYQWRAFQE